MADELKIGDFVYGRLSERTCVVKYNKLILPDAIVLEDGKGRWFLDSRTRWERIKREPSDAPQTHIQNSSFDEGSGGKATSTSE